MVKPPSGNGGVIQETRDAIIMNVETPFGEEISALVGEEVVVDSKGPFLYIGTLETVNFNTLKLCDVDVHDLRDSSTSNDYYLIQSRKWGVRCNRRSVYIFSKEIVSVSRLSSVIEY